MATKTDQKYDFDVSKYMNEMNKMLGDFKVPGVDVESVLSSQRKNVEAVAAANKLALEGMQAVLKRQAEILRQTVDEVSTVGKSLTEAGTPQDKAAKQTELVKEAFERTLANMRELSEMVAKSNSEAFDLLNKRFTQNLDELREMLLKAKK
ncbi:phasin family protein [Telmatospirillum sp. J64-1]|uniref:phasin family protein n=1 Tax=Telmatospirillum sp. J64-1 TaxID=2502183 RepID=UPI00115EB16F|nr:phasin family protein [Telmatospirillum sp. J64-1]